jgi:hypothetical protein
MTMLTEKLAEGKKPFPEPWIKMLLRSFPGKRAPGITCSRQGIIDVLLYRDPEDRFPGTVRAALFHRSGSLFIAVEEPWRRRGIALALLKEAFRRWPISLEQTRHMRNGNIRAIPSQRIARGRSRVNMDFTIRED